MVTRPTCSEVQRCWLRAWQRAQEERLIPFANADRTWSVKAYMVTVVGAGWSDLSCSCPGGRHHRVCKHMAVVAKAIAIGVRPVRGTEKGTNVGTAGGPTEPWPMSIRQREVK